MNNINPFLKVYWKKSPAGSTHALWSDKTFSWYFWKFENGFTHYYRGVNAGWVKHKLQEVSLLKLEYAVKRKIPNTSITDKQVDKLYVVLKEYRKASCKYSNHVDDDYFGGFSKDWDWEAYRLEKRFLKAQKKLNKFLHALF